ncbi:MAG: hypothetical protein RID42_07615 [Alphaproteobacteria bacterium]
MRTFLFSFLSVVLVGCVVVIGSRGSSILPDPFARSAESKSTNLDLLDKFDLAALKTKHAADVPQYEVGLFGNSRIVGVSEDDLPGMLPGTVFNFGVPGSSFRDSVALVEYLADKRALPGTVVISLDNLALNQVSEAKFPGLGDRIRVAANDLSRLIANREPKLTVQSFIDHIRAEKAQLTETFSFDYLFARLKHSFPALSSNEDGVRYRRDGSRSLSAEDLGRTSSEVKSTLTIPAPFVLWPDYFAGDLARLAKVDRSGSQIFIFESPLAPGTVLDGPPSQLEHVQVLRRVFVEQCDQLQLNCVTAEAFEPFQNDATWLDQTHAPAKSLGRFVVSLAVGGVGS